MKAKMFLQHEFQLRRCSITLIICAAATALSATSSSASSSSCQSSTKVPPRVSTGLQNLGSTCYLNAQLQCAYHIPLVRRYILDPMSTTQVTTESSGTDGSEEADGEMSSFTPPDPVVPSESMALKALRLVFKAMDEAALIKNGPVAPRILCQALAIPVMEQQDSQEFWKLLLPALQLTPLTDLYQGAYEDYIKALDGSGRERRREEPFLDLSLELIHGSVEDSLGHQFGTPDVLSAADGNGWKPEKGAEPIDAHKGSLLRAQGLPSILQLHLKRFSFDWNTETTSKINSRFSFPLVLDLSNICAADSLTQELKQRTLYDLQSVVVHVGEFNAGHYYAYIRPDTRLDTWYRFNDETVTEVTYEDVINDAFGGRVSGVGSKENEGIFTRIFKMFQGGSYGFGGPTSNAYVLQYVRRSEEPKLYDDGE